MRTVDFTSIGDLFKFHKDEAEHRVLISKARSGRTIFFINDEETAYLAYDGMFDDNWVGHVHGMPQARGKDLWDFAYETAEWMVRIAKLSRLYCFVRSDDKKLRLFVKQFKMHSVGEFDGVKIYAVDDKQILRFKEVELCQHQ